MATALHRTLYNFVYQMKQIVPTNTYIRNYFTYIDPTFGEVDAIPRLFSIEWSDSDNDLDATDSDYREAWHNYLLRIYYPITHNNLEMHDIILQDRHDIIKRLRRKEFAVGTDDSATEDTGLFHRHRIGDEINKDDEELWVLTIKWRCKVQESEM